ncbi:MAG: hypothetical protein AAFN27_10830 [Pseudomonadota bacterium]
MSTQISEADAAIFSAVNTMMGQIESEHGWIKDLKRSLEQAETRNARLLTSVEAAIHTLPISDRRGFFIRLYGLKEATATRGRPTRDGRQTAMLHFIADRAEGRVTTGEVRVHLKTRGFKATPQYVSNQLSIWMRDGLLTRESHGIYRIEEQNPTLRAVRFRKDREAMLREMKEQLRDVEEKCQEPIYPRPISDYIEE